MLFVLPYRAKNPPDGYPYCTIGLIAVNVAVFLVTTHGFVVSDWAVRDLAISHSNFSFWRTITSIFLHENIEHIGFNMLFLWIFGASVEGRLKHWKFLVLYFAAGILGGYLNDFIYGSLDPNAMGLGASGAISGVLGAYLFMFPFSRISVFYWFGFTRIGVAHWLALYFIGLFIGLELLQGYFHVAGDNVAHLVHLIGFAVGYVACAIFRPAIDGKGVSDAKHMLDDTLDAGLLTLKELDNLLRQQSPTPSLVLTYCVKAWHQGDAYAVERSQMILRKHRSRMVDEADPVYLATYLLWMSVRDPVLDTFAYLKVGSRLEQIEGYDDACAIYRRVYDIDQNHRDAETALQRLGRLFEVKYDNPQAALQTYQELMRRFPRGAGILETQASVIRLEELLNAAARPQPKYRPVEIAPQDQVQRVGLANNGQGADQTSGTPSGAISVSGRMLEL